MLSVIVLLGFLLPMIGAVIPTGVPRYDERMESIDPYLARVLDREVEQDSGDDIGVLVRFRNFPIDSDIEYAEDLGFTVIHRFSSLPLATLHGPRSAVKDMSGYPRTEWMEFDGELELMMEESTSTINATVAWNTWIQGMRERYPQATGNDVTVAVVDTGIDAGHPDLDYKEKTITNLKSDIPGGPFYELENSDTSYGHGTHCAGTIAGNGDASAGARMGVAPEANLIGLCVGDVGITLTNTMQGLEWVYENSVPPNTHNIKIVSNSWGGGASEYDPGDAQSIICQKLTFENNVLVVFAMGNAGRDQHEGEELTASPTGLIPSNIGVAASERDGSGIAYFSSRGERGKNQTYPDVAAPGVKIWSAHARATQISAMSKMGGNPNPYYLAISGTSMATPHVSGLAALMFQVAPSLRVSNRWEDYSGDNGEEWYGNDMNRIHEIEWIMEQSATYLPPDGIPLSDVENDNGVPEPEDLGDTEVGWEGRTIDWAQGYGMVNAEKCVGISITLEHLRRYHDRSATVKDAIEVYCQRGVFHPENRTMNTDTLFTSWEGEFARYAQDQDIPILVQNQSRLIWIPANASEVTITLTYDTINLEESTIGDLTFVVDFGNDESWDYEHPFFGSWTSGTKSYTLGVGSDNSNQYWAVGIYGRGLKRIQPFRDGEYFELRIEYDVGVEMTLDIQNDGTIDVITPKPNSQVSQWKEGTPSSSYEGGSIRLHGNVYDIDRIIPIEKPEPPKEDEGFTSWWLVIAILVLAAIGITYYLIRRGKKRGNSPPSG